MTYPTGPQAQPALFTHTGPEAHRRRATLLRAYLAHHGMPLRQGHALEAVAALHGLPNWRTLLNRPDVAPLTGETAERALVRRFADLELPLGGLLARGAVTLLQNPAILLFDPWTAVFFPFRPAALNTRDLVVQFSETEAMQLPDEAWPLLVQATTENARAVHRLQVFSLGLFSEGIPLSPPSALTFLTGRDRAYQHDSGLFVLRPEVLSPWPLLPMPARLGADVTKRLREGHTLTWAKGGPVYLDGAALLSDVGEPVPEWEDADGSQVAAWRDHLERALPGTSHYVVTHQADRAVQVMMRRGVAEVPETEPMEYPVMVLDDRHPMTQTVAVALAQREARTRAVTVTAHPALIGSAGPSLIKGARVEPYDSRTLVTLAAGLPAGALLVLYLGGQEAEQAALTAARRGVHVLAVTPHRQKVWDRALQDAWQRDVSVN